MTVQAIGSRRDVVIDVGAHADDARTVRRMLVALSSPRFRVHTEHPGGGIDVVIVGPGQAPDVLAKTVSVLRSTDPQARIVAIVQTESRAALRRAAAAGVDGIVLELAVERALAATVEAVYAGQLALPRMMLRQVTRPALSYRERQVLRMVVLGLTNRQIAQQLNLAETTVKSHLSSAFAKLDARSRAEASARVLDPEEGLADGILGPATAGDGLMPARPRSLLPG